jgi:hypothetical protein
VPVARDEERPLPDARRNVAGRAEEQKERVQARSIYSKGNRAPAISSGLASNRAAIDE